MTTVINILVSEPTEMINIVVNDPNDEVINIQVNDVIQGSGSLQKGVIMFEGIVNGETVLTGTTNELTGFTEGSDTITIEDFVNVRVEITRGGQDSPTIGPYAGFVKDLNSDSILLNSALEDGEYLKIKTIPV